MRQKMKVKQFSGKNNNLKLLIKQKIIFQELSLIQLKIEIQKM